MWVYAIAIAVAFAVAMTLVIISDYRTPEQKAEAKAALEQAEADEALAARHEAAAVAAPIAAPAGSGGVATAVAPAPAAVAQATDEIASPVAGHVVSLDDVADSVFASRALGEGVGIVPTDERVVSPIAGTLVTVAKTGHAFGIKSDDGVEVLVHIGIDTVQLDGKGLPGRRGEEAAGQRRRSARHGQPGHRQASRFRYHRHADRDQHRGLVGSHSAHRY